MTRWLPTLLALSFAASTASAESPLSLRLDNTAITWQRVTDAADGGFPERAIADAAGVVVVPQLIKAGFAVAGSYGRGVLIRRNAAGVWQPPVFVTVSGGSIGWQAGVQALDIVLIFRSAEALDVLVQRGLTLGADAAVAAGPFGRKAGAASDFTSNAAVLSYAVSEGFFAGIALDGMLVRIENQNTTAFYRDAGYAPPATTDIDPARLPASAKRLLAMMADAASAGESDPAVAPSAPEDGLVTYGLGEAPVDDTNE